MTVYMPANDAALSAITTTAGDTVLLAAGATYSAAAFPVALLTPSNITLGAIGTGAKPIISGGTIRSDWVFDAPNNVYSRTAYAGGIFLGNVVEDGVPMKFTPWTTDLATTAALMVSGQSLPAWSGSMTFDPTTRTVYIRPSSGVASAHAYIVSDAATAAGNGLSNSTASTSMVIDGLDIRHISRHGIVLINKKGLRITDSDFRYIGGAKPASLWMGNAIELSAGTDGAYVEGCTATDVFDTGYTSQLYEGTPMTLGGHKWVNNSCTRYGLHGFEISAQTANNHLSDIEIVNPSVSDAGTYSWAGDRNGAAVTVLSNSINNSRITRVFTRGLTGTRNKRTYLGYQHGGVNGIEDSACTATWGVAPQSTANGATDHRDLHRNVTDNLGAPSGGQWVASTAQMRTHFTPVLL